MHAVLSKAGPSTVTFLGDEAQDMLPVMRMLNAHPYVPKEGVRICKGRKYTLQSNADAIARMNAKTSNLFGVYFLGLVKEMALTPQVPVYFAFMRYFENLVQRILKDNNFKASTEHKKMLEIAERGVNTVLGEISLLPSYTEHRDKDALLMSAIQKIIQSGKGGLMPMRDILESMRTKIQREIQTANSKPDFAQRIFASRIQSLDKFKEGITYLHKLLETDSDWLLLLQPCSQICEMPKEEPLPVKSAMQHLEAMAEHLHAACLKMIGESTQAMFQLSPVVIADIKKRAAQWANFKELAASVAKKGLEFLPEIEEFFEKELPSFEDLAGSFPENRQRLHMIFISFGLVDGWEAVRQFLGTLHMQRRLAQQPLQASKILPIGEVVKDLEDIFPVMQDRQNFEQFFLTLKEGSFAASLDAKTKYDLDQFLLKAFTTIYQDTTDQLQTIIAGWGEGYLEQLLQQLQKLQRSKSSSTVLFEISDELQHEVIDKLEMVIKNFIRGHDAIKIDLEKLKQTVSIDLSSIEERLEELHFFITCSLNGPVEMLKEKKAQLLALQSEAPSRASKDAEQKKTRRKANKTKHQTEAPLAEAAPEATKKAVILDLSHIKVPSQASSPSAPPHQPLLEPQKRIEPPKQAASAPSYSSASKDQGPDLSSEKSRKLRNFLDLVKKYGYYLARKSGGSHFSYRHRQSNNTISIPQHDVLKVGTARAIINEILASEETKSQIV